MRGGVRTSARTGLQPCRQLSLRGYGETRTWPYTGRVPAAGQAVTVRGRPADEQQRMGRRSWMAARRTGGGVWDESYDDLSHDALETICVALQWTVTANRERSRDAIGLWPKGLSRELGDRGGGNVIISRIAGPLGAG